MKTRIVIVSILILLFYSSSYSQKPIKINGETIDSASGKPIEYVNIGIFKKNIGTVSNDTGVFEINIPSEFSNDSLLFSCIGYQTRKVYIQELLKNDFAKVLLASKTIKLSEVNVVSKRLSQKIVGNKTGSESVGLAISHILGYGSEIGTVIKLPDEPASIKDFNFHIYFDRPDSALFRWKIYSYNKGIDTLLINKNIVFTIKNHYTGDYKIDLSQYQIIAQKKIFVSIECLQEYTHGFDLTKKNDKYFYDRIIISAKLFGSKSFVREVSQGKWEKPEMSKSPGFWLNISY